MAFWQTPASSGSNSDDDGGCGVRPPARDGRAALCLTAAALAVALRRRRR